KNLKILEVDEIDINTINAFKENNEQKNCNINNNPTTFALNCSIKRFDDTRIIVGLDFGLIKENIGCSWHRIDYFENVLLVLTIPTLYSEIDKVIMRQCVYNADLIKDRDSEKLQFITESEATALYCVKSYFKCEIEGKI
ncbi:hypothetical protein RhiirA4_490573, partial [Rhizophagus irregularis]